MKISATAAVLALLRAARSAEGGVVAAPADAAEPVANAGGLRGTDGAVDAPGPGAAESATPRGRRGRRELGTGTTFNNLALINVPALPPLPPPVRICLVGTGIDGRHLDLLTDLETVGSFDRATGDSFVGSNGEASDWWTDETGQGTHVAGIIGAIIPDPYKYRLHVVKVSTPPTPEEALQAIDRCLLARTKIISFSSSFSYDPDLNDELELAFLYTYNRARALIIAPAGNINTDGGSSVDPGAYPTVMSVASVKTDGTYSDSSNGHAHVELAAPGEDILSTCSSQDRDCPGNDNIDCYCTKTGTEYAAAHVAGVAALLMWHSPQCSNNQIRNAMLRSADNDRSPYGWDRYYGRGIVNAGAALELLEREGCAGAGGPDPAAGEGSDLAVGGEWQGCGTEGVGKCDRYNDDFLPCCSGVNCKILNKHEEGWCGCVPEGEVCGFEGGSELNCCDGYECVDPKCNGVKVCQEATGDAK